MRRITRLIDNEHGVAVILALMILLTLTGLVLAFLSASAFEPQISRNHSEAVRARYVAEAGIEYAYGTLATNIGTWNDYLAQATCAQGAVLGAPDSPMPGLGAAYGTFTVRIRNDCKLGDGQLTGVALDTTTGSCDPSVPGAATRDGNCKVIVASTGTLGTTRWTVTVVIAKSAALPINGALVFPGSQAGVNLGVSGFVIDGRDTKLDDQPSVPTGSAPAVFGIAVNPGLSTLTTQLETELAAGTRHDIRGKDRTNASATTRGANTIGGDGALTSQAVTDFVVVAKSSADVTINAATGNPTSLANLGTTCGTDVESSTCWGTASRPKIVHVRAAAPDAGGTPHTVLSLTGSNAGTGILIVENGVVEISGSFRWNGPIIVTGRNVGMRFRGDGNQVVYGAAIVNELNPAQPTSVEGDIVGQPRVLYSAEAIALVQNSLKRRLVTVQNWTEQ